MSVVFGQRWTDSGPLVAVLAAMSMVKSATTLADTVLMSTGRTDRLMPRCHLAARHGGGPVGVQQPEHL